MAVTKPYRRICRQFVDGSYTEGGRWHYLTDPRFAAEPQHYVRGFLLILKDLLELFDFVEPAEENRDCYSYRIHALLLRTSVEFEANCRAVLKANGYTRAGDVSIRDFRKLEVSHHLSGYVVRVPGWTGTGAERRPFEPWANQRRLPWYAAYASAKHDRHRAFTKATFDHLIDAVCGLLVVLSSQFETNDFSPGNTLLAVGGPADGYESGIGGYLQVRFPQDWSVDDRYDFDWETLRHEADPFQNFDYAALDPPESESKPDAPDDP